MLKLVKKTHLCQMPWHFVSSDLDIIRTTGEILYEENVL